MDRGPMAAAAVPALAAAPAPAQLYLTQPDFRRRPDRASDPLVGLPLPGATAGRISRAPALEPARRPQRRRAAMPVLDYLRAVPIITACWPTISVELAAAYTALNNYFKRVHGREGPELFDDYSTATYNNFSTLQAQLDFCQTATSIAKSALAAPKGELYPLAQRRMRELRIGAVHRLDQEMAKSHCSSSAGSIPACGHTSFSSSPERWTTSVPALGLMHSQSIPGVAAACRCSRPRLGSRAA
jgi:hypothetical protein